MEGRHLLLLMLERIQPLMTDAQALHAIRQFMEANSKEPNQGIVNLRFEPTRESGNVVVGQRIGGNLPAIVRSGATFGETVGKLFEGTEYVSSE